MNIKHALLVFLFTGIIYPQITDSVRINLPVDTLRTDTLTSSDSLALSDTLGLLSDSLNRLKADTIKPVYQRAFYTYSSFINKRDFYRRPYTYAADIFTYTPFAFDMSHGTPGAPNNLMLFGTGGLSTGYQVNGINYNDFYGIPFDLNRLQEEYVDSAEVLPLPRSFMYGPGNNNSVINFIGKDFISIKPYSRIRYFEGPFGEGFIDGIFNSVLFRRLNMLFEISNKKTDKRYTNTDFSKWQARIQLKYILNNNLNFISGYDYANTNTGLSGGIDLLNLNTSKGFLTGIYDEILAPVNFSDLRYNTFTHSVYIKSLATFRDNSFTDLSVYYRFNRHELNTPAVTVPYTDNLFKNKIAGIALSQDFSYAGLDFKILGNYENTGINNRTGFSDNLLESSMNISRLSLGGIFTASFFDSLITPSGFYKLLRQQIGAARLYSGYGADLNISINGNFGLYTGYSEFENNFWSGKSKNLQLMVRYNFPFLKGETGYFTRNSGDAFVVPDTSLFVNDPSYYQQNISGFSSYLKVHVYKILLEGKFDYYNKKNINILNFPSAYGTAGLYYKDSLFSGNLDLKAGFDFYYYGKRNLDLSPDYLAVYGKNSTGPDYRLDFFLSGEIDAAAIVFFQWENILGWKYFIVPFYPMPPSGIRFGVSWELFN